jgi:hypothetical protein
MKNKLQSILGICEHVIKESRSVFSGFGKDYEKNKCKIVVENGENNRHIVVKHKFYNDFNTQMFTSRARLSIVRKR